MTRRVCYACDVAAEPREILESVQALHPSGTLTSGGTYEWVESSTMGSDAELRMEATLTGARLELACTYEAVVPYFEWAFAGLVRRSVRDGLIREAKILQARASGEAPPPPPRNPWWAPPTPFTSDQIRIIATLSVLLAIVEYGGSLLTQTVDYVATTYDATNAQLGVVAAVTRVGTLIALVGGVLADRVGRRRLLLWSLGVGSVATALTALAPSLVTYGALQLIVRGVVNLAFAVAVIAAVEEAPEGSRTYTVAIVGIASGLGFVAGVCLLPLADLGRDAWRALYGLGILGLVFLPSISRRLTETRRFEALVARDAPRGRMREVVDQKYGGRFVLLCITGLLVNVFFAPQSQFTNRYLGDERGFSGVGILLLRTATQAVPALAAAYIGGRLAETWGRRPTTIRGLIVAALAFAAFFSFGGPLLWVTLAFATAAEALAGPALSAFGAELFPTEVRGTANAGLLFSSVVGSALGLLAVGYLSDPLGSVGTAMALTSVAPLFVALFLIRHLPEAKGQLLDDVSPSEV